MVPGRQRGAAGSGDGAYPNASKHSNRRAMTTDSVDARRVSAASPSQPLATPVRCTIFLYLGILTVLPGFGSPFGGLIDVPISFFLKNKFHLSAHGVWTFPMIHFRGTLTLNGHAGLLIAASAL
jgi:hypothetical protein